MRPLKRHVFSIGSSLSFVSLLALGDGCSASVGDTSGASGAPTGSAISSGTIGGGGGASTGTSTGAGGGTGGGASGGAGAPGNRGDGGTDPCLAGTLIDDLENQARWTNWLINHDSSTGA